MNRTFWITLIVSVAACFFVIMGQVTKTRSLARELADERTKATIEGDREPQAPNPPEAEPSTEKINRALAAVMKLQPDVTKISPVLAKESLDVEDQLKIDYSGIQAAQLKVFPDFLRSVKGLSVDELIAVAERIPDPKSENSLLKPVTKNWLLLLAAEKDPMRVFRDATLTEGATNAGLMNMIGREDPATALQLLPPMEKQTGKPDSRGRHRADMIGDWALKARIRAGTRLLGTDLNGGLQALSDIHDNYGYIPAGAFGTLGNAPVPEGAIPGLIDAMGRPDYADLRDDLIEMVLRETLFKSGVAATAARMEEMELTGDEFDKAIDQIVENDIMTGEPEEMIDWISEARPDKVPSLITKWVETDINAAADWINRQDSSPARDQFVAEFAVEVSRLDPEGAVAWVNEIQDEELRDKNLPSLIARWAKTDSEAASDWIVRQDPSPARDQSIAKSAVEVSELDPEGAVAWVNEIQDAQLRDKTLRTMATVNPTPDNVRSLLEQTPGDRQENLNSFLRQTNSLFGTKKRDSKFREELLGQMTAAERIAAFEDLRTGPLLPRAFPVIREHFEGTLTRLGHSSEEIDRMLPVEASP